MIPYLEYFINEIVRRDLEIDLDCFFEQCMVSSMVIEARKRNAALLK
jgi:hypothetical protein